MKRSHTRQFAAFLTILLLTSGCVTVAKTTVGGAVKGAKFGTKTAASTTKAVVKVPASIISDDSEKNSASDAN